MSAGDWDVVRDALVRAAYGALGAAEYRAALAALERLQIAACAGADVAMADEKKRGEHV